MAAILDRAMASDLLGCPRPCHGHSYLPTISMSYFPSKNALARLKEKGVVRNITHARYSSNRFNQCTVLVQDLQGQLSVLTLISVFVPPLCYRSGM